MKTILLAILFLLPVLSWSCEGVPSDITSEIKQAIASRYPGNYSVQRTLIEKQCEDYLALQSFRTDVPADILGGITETIARRYPGNYSVQRTLINKQCEDYLYLHP
jgi:uncharacterized protein CbrC (UPF0167 family)